MAIHRGYVGAKTCTNGPTGGARGAMAWFLAKYKAFGAQNSGIYNCRNVRGSSRTTSLHGEWRAVDFGLKWAKDTATYEAFAEQLRLNSKELGIQCIIFNRKIWSGGYESTGWVKYTGVNPHTDHLHVEFTWAASRRSLDDTVALWERELSGKITGTVTPQTSKPVVIKWPTDYADLKVDGIFGKTSIKAFQILMRATGYYNHAVDGELGFYTVLALQKWLRKLGYYKHAQDGKAGKYTWIALQRFLRAKGLYPAGYRIDGIRGSYTNKAWQKYLNQQNKYLGK